MTWSDVTQALIVALVALIPIAAAAIAATIKVYTASRQLVTIAQQTADGPALTGAIQRGNALAVAGGVAPRLRPDSIAKYLHATSPELAVRTGVLAVTGDGTAVPATTPAGAARIAATIATLTPEGAKT